MNKIKILAIIIVAGLILIWLFKTNLLGLDPQKEQTEGQQISETDSPQVVSTKPDPLEEAIISADQTVEITFNRPLENVGEFKVRLESKKDFKIELSSDRKTAKIIPTTPYELGATYTLFITPDTKFDGVGGWGQEKVYHFKTIQYRGV